MIRFPALSLFAQLVRESVQVITGGAIASVAISLASRHPFDPAKPLLDFDMALMLTCPLLLGVSVGADHKVHDCCAPA